MAPRTARIVVIAEDGRIGCANEGCFRFARENGGSAAPIGIGANYFAAIRGEELLHYFRVAVWAVLATGAPFELDYECSSATVYRAYHLRMISLSGEALLLVHSPVTERPHDRSPELPDEPRFRDRFGMIAQCSNCRRVRVPLDLSWHWVPSWVKVMPENVTHVFCPLCRDLYWPRSKRRA